MTPQEIKAKIESGLPSCEARVQGDDGQHFEAVVISAEFDGLSMLKQHQMVYAALGDSMRSDIHALSIKTFTPEQWEQARSS